MEDDINEEERGQRSLIQIENVDGINMRQIHEEYNLFDDISNQAVNEVVNPIVRNSGEVMGRYVLCEYMIDQLTHRRRWVLSSEIDSVRSGNCLIDILNPGSRFVSD
ncbi:hypothetical protein M5689_006491 [Euphorbia peplus]|nr:hypothetical protein M5689_006491 [Euphorbia peplus]